MRNKQSSNFVPRLSKKLDEIKNDDDIAIASKVDDSNLLFGHLFDDPKCFNKWCLDKKTAREIIERLTIKPSGVSIVQRISSIEAGYTYLGQLITHDIVVPKRV